MNHMFRPRIDPAMTASALRHEPPPAGLVRMKAVATGLLVAMAALFLREKVGLRRWAAALVGLAVAVGANTPAQQRAMLHSHGVLHPWFHLVIFAAVAWLAVRSARNEAVQAVLLVVLVLFGGATEFVEYWYHAAPLEYGDIVLDGLGAVAGAVLALGMQRRGLRRSEGHWE